MIRIASTAASAIFSILYASGLMKNETAVSGMASENMGSAGIEGVRADLSACEWYSPEMGVLEDMTCEAIDLRRSTGSQLYSALDRAERCARASGETCILSHEVGFSVPSVFMYNASLARMRIMMVPHLDDEYASTQLKARVLVGDPLQETMHTNDHSTREMLFAKSIKVKYLEGAGASGIRDEHAVLEGYEAYCVQLLNYSLTEACKVEFLM